VEEIDKKAGEVTFSRVLSQMVPREIEREVVRDGKKERVKETMLVPEFRTILYKYRLKDAQAYDGAGKKLDADDVWKYLAVGTPVLVSSDFRPVDAAYFKLLNKDALVLVPAVPPPPTKLTPGPKDS
jgi:hypothetical protein